MGREKTKRELKLQRKLIPVNIIVCILALVASVTLFLLPVINVDVGGGLSNEKFIALAEEKIEGTIDGNLEGTEQENINYKPVVAMIVKNVLGKAEGTVAVSAFSSFKVLTGSGEDKTQMVMDDLFFGENALATRLIDSVVDAVAEMFTTDEGKALLEESVVSVMTKQILKETENQEINGALNDALTGENVQALVGILREMETVEDGDVSEVAGKFAEKVDAMLGDGVVIGEEEKQVIVDQIQQIYDDTKENLTEGETFSMEAVICVTLSKNIDLSQINIEDLLDFNKITGGNGEGAVGLRTVEGELETPDGSEGGNGNEGGEQTPAENTIVTSYDGLLLEIGYDEQKKDEIKGRMRTSLNDLLNGYIHDNGVDGYLSYYEYGFYGMLAFIGPWLILFLFSFFHMLAKNKRFTMWYVKLLCWIPPVIWVALKLFPILGPKFLPDVWNGENGAVIQSLLSAITSYTWISGLCYILLWLVSIFWAFPIKRKIRKERKNPEVEDASDYEGFGEY